jgi:hypothetical protein
VVLACPWRAFENILIQTVCKNKCSMPFNAAFKKWVANTSFASKALYLFLTFRRTARQPSASCAMFVNEPETNI